MAADLPVDKTGWVDLLVFESGVTDFSLKTSKMVCTFDELGRVREIRMELTENDLA